MVCVYYTLTSISVLKHLNELFYCCAGIENSLSGATAALCPTWTNPTLPPWPCWVSTMCCLWGHKCSKAQDYEAKSKSETKAGFRDKVWTTACPAFLTLISITLGLFAHLLHSWTGSKRCPRTLRMGALGCCWRNDRRRPLCLSGFWRPPESVQEKPQKWDFIDLERKDTRTERQKETHLSLLFVEGSRNVVGVKVSPQESWRRSFFHFLRVDTTYLPTFCDLHFPGVLLWWKQRSRCLCKHFGPGCGFSGTQCTKGPAPVCSFTFSGSSQSA